MKVFVEDNDYGIKRMCVEQLGWTSTLERFDIAVFSGGSDVGPSLYHEKNVASGCDTERDNNCLDLFFYCKSRNIPMIGICRGGQFLHVANGGSMWQDVDGHALNGTHELTDEDGTVHSVTSTHHQMMRVTAGEGDGYDGQLISWTNRSNRKLSDKGLAKDDFAYRNDIEVMWYPSTRSLCYQPHPEYGVKSCFDHFVKLLDRFELRQ